MTIFRKTMLGLAALALAGCLNACSDANEYEDTNTNNPTWGNSDGTAEHPASLANTKYVRGKGLKYNALGKEVLGFVESLEFVSDDSVTVKMSEYTPDSVLIDGTWTNESNDEFQPHYVYTYAEQSGKIEIKKKVIDDKGNVSLPIIFMGTAVSGTNELITIVHYGDTPAQTYLVKQ